MIKVVVVAEVLALWLAVSAVDRRERGTAWVSFSVDDPGSRRNLYTLLLLAGLLLAADVGLGEYAAVAGALILLGYATNRGDVLSGMLTKVGG